jgi:hypothetical protein
MTTSVVPFAAPDTALVEEAWRQLAASVELQQSWPVLLAGLPAVAAGAVRDEHSQPLALPRLVSEVLGRNPDSPFLPELARCLLALGYAHQDGGAEDDPLLNPGLDRIDGRCEHEALSTARALAAVERANAAVLAAVVSRRLTHLQEQERREQRPGQALAWVMPFISDETAQCLLVNAVLARRPPRAREEGEQVLRALLPLHEQRADDWPPGPLTTACALGLLLRRREKELLKKFAALVRTWKGWGDEDGWPTRHPESDITQIKYLLTDRVAAIVGVADRKLWRRDALEPTHLELWPPLATFCLPAARRGHEERP